MHIFNLPKPTTKSIAVLLGCLCLGSRSTLLAQEEHVPSPFSLPNSAWGTPYATTARAEARISKTFNWGDFRLTPYAGGGLSYDDNLYWNTEGQQKETDWIKTFAPGIMGEFYHGDYGFVVDYNHEWNWYKEHKEEDYQSDYLTGSAIYNLPKTSFLLSDQYSETTRDNFEAGARLDEKRNTVLGNIERVISQKTRLALDSSYQTTRYETYDYYNTLKESYQPIEYDEFRIGLRPFYAIFPRTDIFADYTYGDVRAKQYTGVSTLDAKYHEVGTGLRGEITSKSVGIIRVGYQKRDFDSEQVLDFDEWVMGASLTTQFSSKMRSGVDFTRDIQPSVNTLGHSTISTRVSPYISREIFVDSLTVTLNGVYEYDEYLLETGEKDSDAVYWRAGGFLDWHPGTVMTLGGGYAYSVYTPDPGDKSVKQEIMLRASLSY